VFTKYTLRAACYLRGPSLAGMSSVLLVVRSRLLSLLCGGTLSRMLRPCEAVQTEAVDLILLTLAGFCPCASPCLAFDTYF
jgi:hypothetical protein